MKALIIEYHIKEKKNEKLQNIELIFNVKDLKIFASFSHLRLALLPIKTKNFSRTFLAKNLNK